MLSRKYYIIIFLFLCSILLSSCGTSSIVVSNADVDLYVDNIYKGKGHVEVQRTGFPKKMSIEAKYHGATVGQIVVKRKMNTAIFLTGCFTYGIGSLFSFRYPDTIIVPISLETEDPGKSKSIWQRPPGNWK